MLSVAASAALASAQSMAADFYQGKTINLIVGNNASGGYAIFGRTLAEFLPRHIPGNPRVVVQYMPGAAGLTMANYIFTAAARDGTVIGLPLRNVPFEPIIGSGKVPFKVEDFTWLGATYSLSDDAYVMVVRADSLIKSIEDLRKPGKPTVFGGQAPGSANVDVVEIAKDALHLNIQLIRGYPSPGDIKLALENGEITGKADGWKSLAMIQPEDVRNGWFRCVAQFRQDRWKGLPDCPTALELTTNEADRQLITLVQAQFLLGRPYLAPPSIPAEAAAILRKAFVETHSDPGYIAANEKLGYTDIAAQTDAGVLAILAEAAKTPASVIARYKANIGEK
jgi:tripartite-type tricarboxylate transporter receptor subunit TctC